MEEFWIFLVESSYNKVSMGHLILEDQHKLLFRQEVLEHRYIEKMLKDIRRNYAQLEASMQGLPPSAFNLTKAQAILNEIGLGWIELESEINTSIQEKSTFDTISLEDDNGQ